MLLLGQKVCQRLLVRGNHMDCGDLAMFLHQQLCLPEALVERYLLLKPIRKEQKQEKPSIRDQLKAAKTQPERKAPSKAKKHEMGLE